MFECVRGRSVLDRQQSSIQLESQHTQWDEMGNTCLESTLKLRGASYGVILRFQEFLGVQETHSSTNWVSMVSSLNFWHGRTNAALSNGIQRRCVLSK